MYKPAPVRPTKTNISRSRNGCQNCRQRRSKCDEQKPSCRTCVRLGRTCEFNQKPFQFRITTSIPREQVLPSMCANELQYASWPIHSPAAQLSTDERESTDAVDSLVAMADHGYGNDFTSSPHVLNWEYSHSSEAPSHLGALSHGPGELELAALSQLEENAEESAARLSPRIVLDSPLPRPLLQSDGDLLYITHWGKYCLSALNPLFSQLSTRMELCSIFRDAILALSACNLSRMHPELKLSGTLTDRKFIYRPHQTHLLHSQMYYNSAIRKLSRLSSVDYHSSIRSVLAAILLFGYMESSICNFRGHYCHVEGISQLLTINKGEIKATFNGTELLATWAQLKCYNWWIGIHFSTLNFQISQSALRLSLQHQDMNESRSTSRAILLSIMCESYRLSSKAFLRWWKCHNMSSQPIDSCRDSSTNENYKDLLFSESKRLEEWVSKLGASEMPTEPVFPAIPTNWTLSSASSRLKPLHFLSHEASINYAYYTAARVMQCFMIEDELNSISPVTNCVDNDYWTILFLRVVQGIDHANCVRENVYTIGISGLLLACILRSTRLTTGLLMETWVKDFQHAQVFEEGSLPISQIVAIVSMINRERRAGFDIFAISPVLEDGGGSGKSDSYTNQRLSDVLVFGRHRQTGSAFSKCVSVTQTTKVE